MAKYTVITMPGDGIGNQVLPESLRVLKAVGFDADYIHADIGWDCWCAQGNALPDRTIELLTKHKLGLFGAITSKPNKAAQSRTQARTAREGLRLLLAHRHHAPEIQSRYLHASLRRIHRQSAELHPQEHLGRIRRAEDRHHRFPPGTEGMYAGVEWTNPPEIVRAALNSHPRFKAFATCPDPRSPSVAASSLARRLSASSRQPLNTQRNVASRA